MDYYQKYQKYKFKYLNLLNQSGGNKKSIDDITKRLYDPTNHEYDNTEDVINIFEEFIKKDGLLLQHLDSNFITNKMYKLAVGQNGCAIKYINSLISDYVNICKLAVQQSGFALEFVDKDKMNDTEYQQICDLAVKQNPNAQKYIK